MYGSEVLFVGKEILDFETVHLSFLKKNARGQTTNHISYYLWGYRKVSSLFNTTNYSFEIMDLLDLLA